MRALRLPRVRDGRRSRRRASSRRCRSLVVAVQIMSRPASSLSPTDATPLRSRRPSLPPRRGLPRHRGRRPRAAVPERLPRTLLQVHARARLTGGAVEPVLAIRRPLVPRHVHARGDRPPRREVPLGGIHQERADVRRRARRVHQRAAARERDARQGVVELGVHARGVRPGAFILTPAGSHTGPRTTASAW